MSERLPKIGNKDAKEWCDRWDLSTHVAKLGLCGEFGVAYQTGKNYRALNRAAPVRSDYRIPPDTTWQDQLEVLMKLNELIAVHQERPTEISIGKSVV